MTGDRLPLEAAKGDFWVDAIGGLGEDAAVEDVELRPGTVDVWFEVRGISGWLGYNPDLDVATVLFGPDYRAEFVTGQEALDLIYKLLTREFTVTVRVLWPFKFIKLTFQYKDGPYQLYRKSLTSLTEWEEANKVD